MAAPPVVVTFALPQESSDFRRALRRRGAPSVRVEHLGVGPAMAGEQIRRLLSGEKPRFVVCAGFAGGLDPQLALADLVIAENLSTPDLVARARLSAPTGARCVVGEVICRAEPAETVEAKAALFQETGALAIDMESETVAAACRAAGVPVLIVRTISDPATAPLPVPFADWFDLPRQRPNVSGLLKSLVLHPGRIFPFARFVGGLGPARRTLAGFLLQFLLEREQSTDVCG